MNRDIRRRQERAKGEPSVSQKLDILAERVADLGARHNKLVDLLKARGILITVTEGGIHLPPR